MTSPAVLSERPRILVWAQPGRGSALPHLNDEIARLQMLEAEGLCEVLVRIDRTWTALAEALRDVRPQYFHFIGHGEKGKLLGVDDADGISLPSDIGGADLVRLFRSSSSALKGVFLNGCETSHWMPHFIPAGGWAIGTTHEIEDLVALRFAPLFYRALLTGADDSAAFDSALAETTRAYSGVKPPVVRWREDPEPSDFIHYLFDRQAFYTAGHYEGSMDHFQDALLGVRKALTTRRLSLREGVADFSTVYCSRPLNSDVVSRLRRHLDCVIADLTLLRTEFPGIRSIRDTLHGLEHERVVRLNRLADRVDESRNLLLDAVNSYVPRGKESVSIPLSSASGRGTEK